MTKIRKRTFRKRPANGDIAIELKNVGKKYLIHHERPTLARNVNRILNSQQNEEYWALKDVNLKIKQGDKVGVYGSNGSGKTTLFKIIAGLTKATTGSVNIKGSIASLIDLEAGFHPDLTGQENIFLNGLIVGMSKSEIQAKFSKIVKFAEIGNFITAPLYTYSSGMKLRLGFSIAIYADSDILLLDEIMDFGDVNFRRKSNAAMQKMFKSDKTILMISQWANYLGDNCDYLLKIG